MTTVLAEVEDALGADPEVVRVPALVRGRLVLAPRPNGGASAASHVGRYTPARAERLRVDGAYALRRPILDPGGGGPTGASQTVLLPAVEPSALLEHDPGACATLARLPFAEVLDYVAALRTALAEREPLVHALAAAAAASSPAGARLTAAGVEMVRGMLDAGALADAVDRDLGGPGRRYLDEWVAAGAGARSGIAAELSRRLFAGGPGVTAAPQVRAFPTRQLHITAGNALAIPVVCLLRALATKSPAVIKSSSESFVAGALLAVAMHAVDPDHPLTRHTSLVCWPGGDRRIEDRLFAPGAFDRLVVWGSAATLAAVRARAPRSRTLFLEPRTGVSLIGNEALRDGQATAVRAAADSLADDQQACSASLIHYVEGSAEAARGYCEALRAVLARWDAALPHTPTADAIGRRRLLRRGRLAGADWYVNPGGSAVVCTNAPPDVEEHPAGRCVVVVPVASLDDAVAAAHSGISTVGIAPESRRATLRDAIAARGVSHVVPLGEADRVFAGMPHDGMRILSQLVNWATA